MAAIPAICGTIKVIGTDKYAENSASEMIYLQSIVYK